MLLSSTITIDLIDNRRKLGQWFMIEKTIEDSFSKGSYTILPYLSLYRFERERQDSWGDRTAANSCSLVEDRDADATETNLTVPSIKRVTVRGSRVFISIV